MAYKMLFFLCLIGVMNLKEIGERLKETRESIGISIEEAAEDLKMRPTQIENIESGNMKAFKDVFYLKYFIRDYAKYLGMNSENMIDEFNEYLFDCTSRISLADIQKAKKKSEVEKSKLENRVASPYTIQRKNKNTKKIIIIALISIIIIGMLSFFIINNVNKNNKKDNNVENII